MPVTKPREKENNKHPHTHTHIETQETKISKTYVSYGIYIHALHRKQSEPELGVAFVSCEVQSRPTLLHAHGAAMHTHIRRTNNNKKRNGISVPHTYSAKPNNNRHHPAPARGHNSSTTKLLATFL